GHERGRGQADPARVGPRGDPGGGPRGRSSEGRRRGGFPVRHVAGYALKSFGFFLAPIFMGLLVATWKGWDTLSSSPRLLAGWGALLVFFFVLPLFLARAGRAAMGHEPRDEARRVWLTGAAAFVVGAAAL